MPDEPTSRMTCGCGVWYAWSADHADQRLRCSCGRTLQLPADPPEHDVELPEVPRRRGSEEDPPADCRACPACLSLMGFDAVVCVECGFDRNQGRRVHVEQKRIKTERELALEVTEARELRQRRIASLVIIAVVVVWQGLVRPVINGAPVLGSVGLMIAWLALGTGALVGVTALAYRFIDEQLDAPGWLIAQLAAVFAAADVTRNEALMLFHIAEPGGDFVGSALSAIALIFPLAMGFFILPGIAIHVVASYLMRLDVTSSTTVTALYLATITILFGLAVLAGRPG